MSRELLDRLAGVAPALPVSGRPTSGDDAFDLEAWIRDHQLPVVTHGPWNGGYRWILSPCPWNPAHTNRSAYVIQLANGARAAGCHHNGCRGRNWRALRNLFSPDGNPPESTTTDHGHGLYLVREGRLCSQKMTQHGPVLEDLCNFSARVAEEVVLDDGLNLTRAFTLAGELATGEPLPPVRVPAPQFASMTWVVEQWGLRAIVRAGFSTRDRLREAIQHLSPEATRRQIFTHTGWREIDDRWVYLTALGAVGREGCEVDLGPELARYDLPRQATDPLEAMRASLRLLQVAPFTITVPLWAAAFRAPLACLLPPDLTLWLEGLSGSLKSTLAALFLAHYGPFDRTHLPGTWTSTANQLERRAFVLKDTLFVIDDYAPSPLDARELQLKAARLIRAQGNVAGRGRLRSDLSERLAFPPRGLVVATGEQHPPGQSVLLRTLVVQMRRSDISLPALSDAQAESHLLPHGLSGYVAWLAPQMATLRTTLRERFDAARSQANATYLRLPEVLAHLRLGLDFGLAYAQDVGACDGVEADELRARGWEALQAQGRNHEQLVEAERPVERFVRVLSTLITQRLVTLLPRRFPVDINNLHVNLIGWHDQDALYLLPEATYRAVCRFCRDAGEPFPLREDRLRQDLVVSGISDPDPERLTASVRVGTGGGPRRVLRLRLPALEEVLGEPLDISSRPSPPSPLSPLQQR